jgi:hypothetical protein
MKFPVVNNYFSGSFSVEWNPKWTDHAYCANSRKAAFTIRK